MFDIFISYARSTVTQAEAVEAALRALGYGVWRDDALPAHRAYTDVLEERLRAAKAVVVVWSAEAVKSQWVRAEAEVAREAGTLVQLSIDGAPLPLPFNQIQCADLVGWTGDAQAHGWRKIIASVAELVGAADDVSGEESAPRLPGKPSIAVLPFANLSGDPEQEYFADGMVVEIVEALSRFKSLFIIASGSGLSFKGKAISHQQTAQQLGVRYLLEGSVRKSGNRVRIGVQLVDALEDAQIWTERFDGTLDDVFALQDAVASAVASQIEPSIASAELQRANTRPTQDLGTYDLYLRAYQQLRAYERATLLEALALLDQAAARDPGYAKALALAASVQTSLLIMGWADDPAQTQDVARDQIRRALLAGDDDADVQTLAAWALALLGDHAAAEKLIERALTLNSGASLTWLYSGYVKNLGGQPELAPEHLRTGLRLDPRSPDRPFIVQHIGGAMFLLGRFEAAIDALREAVQLRPNLPSTLMLLTAAYAHAGRMAEAKATLARLNTLDWDLDAFLATNILNDPKHQEILRSGLVMAGADG